MNNVLIFTNVCYAFILMMFFNFSCTQNVNLKEIERKYSSGKYCKVWENGCVRLNVLLVTPELSVIQNSLGNIVDKKQFDLQIKRNMSDSVLKFRLHIEPDTKCIDTLYAQNSDIVYGFGRSDNAREIEIKQFNFNLSEKIWLKCNDEKIKPMYCHVENNFGLDNGRDIWLGFSINNKQLLSSEKCALFFQNLTPVSEIIAIEWSSKFLKKAISGGQL